MYFPIAVCSPNDRPESGITSVTFKPLLFRINLETQTAA
jgi:hypothetical protein